MGRFIRAVLFDLGNTLMHGIHEWEPVKQRADQALVASLQSEGYSIPDNFAEEFRSRLKRYYLEREANLYETTYASVLKELLRKHLHTEPLDSSLRRALDALYTNTQENWRLDPEAVPMLRRLELAGYRMGLVSNAGDDQDVKALVERFRIDRYFDFVLTSAACSYRKPHPRIFELALVHWGFELNEAALVGDTLEADILGANRAGLFSIWLRNGRNAAEISPEMEPNAVIDHLEEIPALLEHIS